MRIDTKPVQLLILAGCVAVLGAIPSPERALLLLGALTTFVQPVQTLVAAWVPWRPRRPAHSVAVLAVQLVCAAGLTVAAQAVVGRFDVRGLVAAQAAGRPTLDTFPYLIVPSALIFVIFLQFTMVWEQQPFARARRWGGVVALAVSTIASAVVYVTVVNWDSAPPAQAAGLWNPGGPVDGLTLATWLICVAAAQVFVMVVLRGEPGARARSSPAARIAINNFVVVALGTAMFATTDVFHIAQPDLSAVAGSFIAGSRLALVLWPGHGTFARRQPMVCRVGLSLLATALLWGALYVVTRLSSFTQQPASLWIAVTALNLISGAVTFLDDLTPPVHARSRPQQDAGERIGLVTAREEVGVCH